MPTKARRWALAGIWVEGGKKYKITQSSSGGSITAHFHDSSSRCTSPGDQAFTASHRGGNEYEGSIVICNPDECVKHGELPKSTATSFRFRVADDGMSISGSWLWRKIDIYERRPFGGGFLRGCQRTTETKWKRDFAASRLATACGELPCYIEKPRREWRPEHDGNPVVITATVEDRDNRSGQFRFTLFAVSKEPGIAMNWGNDSGYDLSFADDQPVFSAPEQTSDGYQITTNEIFTSVEVQVQPHDYGAWGRIRAEINVDGMWCPCAERESNSQFVNIPHDADDNRIADFWEELYKVNGQSADSDLDDSPATKETGDGFSNYEEYRGFFLEDGHMDIHAAERKGPLYSRRSRLRSRLPAPYGNTRAIHLSGAVRRRQ